MFSELQPISEIGGELYSLGLLSLGFLQFTYAQRKWIKERDDYSCQCPEHKGHGGGLDVHHIIPEKLAQYENFDPDTPNNGITLCANHH